MASSAPPMKKPRVMAGPCVWWIRNDARLQDNPVLRSVNGAALCDRRPFAAVYVFDPRFLGHGKMEASRARTLVQSVRETGESLADRGSKLFVCYGRPEDIFGGLPRGTEMKCLREHCSATHSAIDRSVEAACIKNGSKLRRDAGAAWLYHPHDWPYGTRNDEVPSSFDDLSKALGWTNLSAAAERRDGAALIRASVPAPSCFAPPPEDLPLAGMVSAELLADDAKMLQHLGYVGEDISKALVQEAQEGGEGSARALLDKWIAEEGAATTDGTSWEHVSRHMSMGCITAREVFSCAAQTPNFTAVTSRLLWREFHRLHDKPEDKEPEMTVAELKAQLLAKDKIIEELRKVRAAEN